MVNIYQSCKGDEAEFKYVKQKHNDLPWGWIEGLKKEDFDDLEIALLSNQKDMGVAWEITGSIAKLYKPLKKLEECKELKETETTYPLNVTWEIWFEKEDLSPVDEDKEKKFIVICVQRTKNRFRPVIQLKKEELQEMMGIKGDPLLTSKLNKANLPESTKKLVFFMNKSLTKYFGDFMMKVNKIQLKNQEETKNLTNDVIIKTI